MLGAHEDRNRDTGIATRNAYVYGMANLWNAVLLTALAALACASPTVGDDSSLRPRADVAGAVDLSISLKDKALRNKTAP